MSIQYNLIQYYLLITTEYNRRKMRNQGSCLSKTEQEGAFNQALALQEDTARATHYQALYVRVEEGGGRAE